MSRLVPSRCTTLSLVLLVAALAGAARAEDDATAVTVTARILNPGPEGPPRPRYEVSGRVPYLPDGAILHVSLIVRDRSPDIQGAFFQVETKGGNFSGYQEWQSGSFAPIGYRTVVTLAMQAQNPAVRRFLSRELGYVSDTNAVIGTVDEDLGTPEERAAFAIETLRALRGFTERAKALLGELEPRTAAPADATWQEWVTGFSVRLKQLHDDMEAYTGTRILWYEAHPFATLAHCLSLESRGARKHGQGKPDGRRDVVSAGNDLTRLTADIDARLPAEPGDRPPPAPPPTTEAAPPTPPGGGRPLPPGVPPPGTPGGPKLPPGVPPPAGGGKPGGR